MQLSFDQAVRGTQISVSVPKADRCPTCHGSGAKPGSSPHVCPRCGGRGIDAQSQGFFSISQPCPQCGGTGEVIDDPCETCGGSGLTRQTKRYKVNIPAGVKDGTRIRLAGKGEAGPRGGPPGDLYVTTRVTPSPVFKQLADGNLEVTVPITIAEAIHGAGDGRVCRPSTARSGSGSRPAPSTEPCSGCAARVRRVPAGGGAATSATGSRSTCRVTSTMTRHRRSMRWPRPHNGSNPRESDPRRARGAGQGWDEWRGRWRSEGRVGKVGGAGDGRLDETRGVWLDLGRRRAGPRSASPDPGME